MNHEFTYLKDTNLDMRMNSNQTLTAKRFLIHIQRRIINIFLNMAMKKNSFKITNRIIKNRPYTTFDLVNICDKVNYKKKVIQLKKYFKL